MDIKNIKLSAVARAVATAIGLTACVGVHASVYNEKAHATGSYAITCHEAKPGMQAQYEAALADFNAAWGPDEVAAKLAVLEQFRQVKWEAKIPNVVCTIGKNFLLDSGLGGSAYTAAFYLGLISSVSYTAVSAADTMASHAGWLEAGATNAPTYSGARKTAAWSAASGGSKALSAGLVFTFTGSGTVKGCFLTTVSTVDGTTGTLYSAGLFSGGDQPVVSTNTLTVSYTASL